MCGVTSTRARKSNFVLCGRLRRRLFTANRIAKAANHRLQRPKRVRSLLTEADRPLRNCTSVTSVIAVPDLLTWGLCEEAAPTWPAKEDSLAPLLKVTDVIISLSTSCGFVIRPFFHARIIIYYTRTGLRIRVETRPTPVRNGCSYHKTVANRPQSFTGRAIIRLLIGEFSDGLPNISQNADSRWIGRGWRMPKVASESFAMYQRI